jgi:glycosyltransferase involved in cell wall biosynthesis
VHLADDYLLSRRVRRLFVLSRTVQARLQRWNGVSSEVLHPPAPQRAYRCDGYGDYLFAVSRLAPLKRMSLLIEALARPEAAGIRCVIAGEGEERASLQHAIDLRALTDRVTLIGRVDERQLIDHFARCRAVCFLPFDEDYGFVTVEAFASSKPVITCTDSGGPAELVSDGVSGYVCAPRPETVATAMRDLMQNAELAGRMGRIGCERASAMTWRAAVKALLIV